MNPFFLPIIDLGDGFIVTDIASSCCSYHSCVLLENGTDFVGLKCWGRNIYGQLGLNDTENRGDNGNEMGSYLPFVSILAVTGDPTAAPSESPSVSPTNSPISSAIIFTTSPPTTKPTDLPSTVPSTAPTTSEPTNDPISGPSASPTIEPTAKPSTSSPTTNTPTMAPTTECGANQNCTECLQMNSDEMTLCLWHSTNDECVSLLATGYIDEDMIFEESSCSEEAKSTESTTTNFSVIIIIIIAVGSVLGILCCILIFLVLRKRKMTTNQGPEEQETSMVNIDIGPPTKVTPKVTPRPPPRLNADGDKLDSPGKHAIQPGDSTDEEGIEDMFTTAVVTTPGFPSPSVHSHVSATTQVEGAR